MHLHFRDSPKITSAAVKHRVEFSVKDPAEIDFHDNYYDLIHRYVWNTTASLSNTVLGIKIVA